MADAWMHAETSDRERAGRRRCSSLDCDHLLLPVQDHCPECGILWSSEPPPKGSVERK